MMKHWWRTLVLAVVLGTGAWACGGSGDAGDDSDSQASAGGEDDDFFDEEMGDEPGDSTDGHQSARELLGINPPEQPWAEMSHEDREMDMVGRFHPIFREFFVEHDAEQYADFGCADCHGPDMADTHFEMPSAHLIAVPPPNTPAYAAMHDEHHEVMEFMEHEVTPAIQTMLGMPGFTCNGCHPTAG